MENQWFQLHYYLRDNSHSMDAFVRNKCEKEILALAEEVAKNLGIPVLIETLPYAEGGLKEIWKLIGKNKDQLNTLTPILALLLSGALAYPQLQQQNKELEQLTKEATRLDIEKKKLEIEKLRSESLSPEKDSKALDQQLTELLNRNIKIAIRRSNFYKNLVKYKKVESVGFVSTDNLSSQNEENIVPHFEFQNFVLTTDKLPTVTDQNALIEIFAPVLIEGGYNWRGFYLGNAITFSMNDEEFKNSVLSQEVKFQHGTQIRCVLKIHRKFDEIGDVVITGYAVTTVLELSQDEIGFIETKHGKKYKQNKKQSDGQIDIFNIEINH